MRESPCVNVHKPFGGFKGGAKTRTARKAPFRTLHPATTIIGVKFDRGKGRREKNRGKGK